MKTKDYKIEGFSEFPQRLRELRKAYGYSQEDVAKIMNVSRVAYGNYERGELSRFPDAKQIYDFLSDMNKRKRHGEVEESADYLLCMSTTRNPVYAEIADTTGLSENSIKYLETAYQSKKSILNHLLQEEYVPYPMEFPPCAEPPHKSDEELYQEYLKDEEWRRTAESKSILEHISEEWSTQDYYNNETEEEMIARAMRERENDGFYHTMPTKIPADNTAQQYAQFEKIWAYEAKENKKSNLLSCIEDFVAYQSGCSLYTLSKEEHLSQDHHINIGIGNGKTVMFPSEESDKLFEFMLIQKIIDALRIFKSNYYEQCRKE